MNVLKLFDNVKLPVKIGLIGALALIALSLPIYNYTQLSLANQSSYETELHGLKPTSMVVSLTKLIAEHRGMSAKLISGDKGTSITQNNKARNIDEQIALVELAISAAPEDSALISDVRDIKNNWNTLNAKVSSGKLDGADSFKQHSQLIQRGDMLKSIMSQHYLLSYDPAPASYHAFVANYQNLPRLADALGKIRGAGAGVLVAQNSSAEQRFMISNFLNDVDSPLQDLQYNMRISAAADPRFVGFLQEAQTISSNIGQLLTLAQSEVIDKQQSTYNANSFFNEYTNVISDLYSLHDNSTQMLRIIIEERVSDASASRFNMLSLIIGILIVASLVGAVIVISLKRSSDKLVSIFNEISQGNFAVEFTKNRKDEMGIIEYELSKLNTQLEAGAVIAIEASKVKQALDNSTTCFMMLDAKRDIIYMNSAICNFLKKYEQEIRKDLPQFNAQTLLGASFDTLRSHSAHEHRVFDQFTAAHTAQLLLGGLSFQLNVSPIKDENGDDLGNSIEWIDMTDVFEEERRVARILEALDSVSTNVMIANAEREIIYVNRAIKDMLQKSEAQLRKELPHFTAAHVLGKNIDIFNTDFSYQNAMLEGLRDKIVTEIKIGSQNYRLTASPINDDNGECIGSVVEWLDRTKEIKAEKEIANIVEASLAGDFTQRIDETDKDEFTLILAQGLNQLITTTESGLNDVSKVLLALSEGDLSKRVTRDYRGTFNDLKNYCNTTSENLAEMISSIREASDTITNASAEIAAGNSDLSIRTEQQASSLEETASSMEQLTSTVKLNAQNAHRANGLASQASQVAGNGGALIREVVTTMASINESSQKISDIIGVIDGIAFQTNILALNAAVEAARAGEQGRGFAVVASEVRTLAQRSANAAKDIKNLISDSVSKVASGNKLVNQSGDTMQEIVVSIQRVNDIMNEIAAASVQQSSGIEEVSKAVTQMDEMTQQNAALVEEAAAAAESMRAQAVDLNAQVGSFKLSNANALSKTRSTAAQIHSQRFDEQQTIARPALNRSIKPVKQVIAKSSQEDEWENF